MNTTLHRAFILIGLFALTVGLPPGAASAADWFELGPAPTMDGSNPFAGRISAVVCSRTDPNRYYVAGADGGVWRSDDGGDSWTPVTDHMPTTAMGALAIHPTDHNIVYAGTGESNYANHCRFGLGIYKTVDGGENWQHFAQDVFAGRCFSNLVINPQNPQILYAAITRAGGFPELAAAKGHPNAQGPLGVFRSIDGGENWQHLTNGIPGNLSATGLAIDNLSPNVLYAGIGRIFGHPDNGIYKSVDGGDSWTKLTADLPSANLGRISVAVAPSDSNRVYALLTQASTESGGSAEVLGAYRSDDAGANWRTIPVGSIQATYGWFLSLITIHPTQPDTVLMGGVTLRRSTNAGEYWSTVTPPHVDMHAADWDANGQLLIGHDGGVHRTDNLGSSWQQLNENIGTIQFYAGVSTHPTDDDWFYGGTQDNGSNRRTNDWVYWVHMLGGDGGWTQVDRQDPNRVFAEYQGSGNLFRSVNGGSGFSYAGSGISGYDRNCFLPPYLISPENPYHMLYATHRIYRSTNGGGNWSAISGDLTNGGSAAVRALAIAPSDANIVYAATNDGRVLRSDNGGANWTAILEDHPGWPRVTREIFVHPTQPLTVYLATAHFDTTQIRRSVDGGQNWQPLDQNFPDIPVNVLAVDVRGAKNIIFAGAEDGLYRSVNDGASWHRYGQGLPNCPVIDIRLEPQRQRLVAATQGRGLWRIPIAIPGDMNGDGLVNNFDIDPFVLALTNRPAYEQQYPNIDADLAGDLNGDNAQNNFDIDPLVELLTE